MTLRAALRTHWWLLGLAAIAGVAGGAVYWKAQTQRPGPKPQRGALAEYQKDPETLEREYRKFHGKLLRDPEMEQQFIRAAGLASEKQYTPAIEILETVAKDAGTPVVFHDLGLLYAAVGDHSRAIGAFREALARDAEYGPVRDAVERLKWVGEQAAPLKSELEPNNSAAVANLVTVGTPVEGEIGPGDTDVFKFITPPAPRDILEIEVANLTGTLELGIRVTANDIRREQQERVLLPAGQSLTRYIAQPPNTPLYLEVWGARDTTGQYRVSLRALKRFDTWEPNDDIFGARRVEPGADVEANIMDGEDTDFYMFQSPRSGTVEVEVENHSPGLIPALTTFGPDRRNSGFAPSVRKSGASLRHKLEVEEHQVYYLQVWSEGGTSGKYTLRVK